MKIATGWSTEKNSTLSVNQAYDKLVSELENPPHWLLVYATETHSSKVILDTLTNLAPDIPMQGSTSCRGVMTSAGFHSKDNTALGLFGIFDEEGAYGVGHSQINSDARAAGAQAIQEAIRQAKRPGEVPDLVWVSGLPGHEELVILGIQDVIGSDVPIAGGSSADNEVTGNWQQFSNGQLFTDAVVVTAMYPSVSTHFAFHSGYSPTTFTGTVTRAEGRTLHEINGRPAAIVYNEWTNGIIEPFLSGGNILAATTLHPLGRRVGTVGNMPYHRLSHPDSVTEEKGLTLFSDMETGDEIILMSGTRKSLITRAGRVARKAISLVSMNTRLLNVEKLSGALVIYCAGCMLAIQNEMDSVATEINDALGGVPFISPFTFGEQGCFVSGENHHGNLMISIIVFEKG